MPVPPMPTTAPARRVPLARATLLATLFATLPAACDSAPANIVTPIDWAAPVLTRAVVLAGLNGPWDIAFTPDGTMLYTEKCRGLSVRHADGSITRLFGTAGSTLVAADLACEGQSGMHGVALDPQFAVNRRAYVFMASTQSTPRTNRVMRIVLSADLRSAAGRTDIINDLAFKHVGNAHGGAGAHSGGRIRFGPDGFLYVTTGDNHDGQIPQSPTMLGGKVLRVTVDGVAAPGNGAPAGFDPRIYTYGHRNVQGIAFRPGTGQPFVTDHGPSYTDEVTGLRAGGNAGWDPANRPGLRCADGYCGYAGSPASMPMTDLSRFPDAMRPSWTNDDASQGIGPATFLTGSLWGSWNGSLAVGIMGGRRLVILALDQAGMARSVTESGLPAARYRGVTQAPDGSLYVATDAGEIWRVTPGR